MQHPCQLPTRADPLLAALIAQSTADAPAGPSPSRSPDDAQGADDALLMNGGATLGGVQLLSLIGEGGMGRVYLGHHQTLDIEVAVKVMRQGERAQAERFVNEARLAARTQHANIVRTLHAGYEGERLFLVQEYVAGINLKQLLRQSGPLPWTQAAHFAVQAARGLGAAHQAGVVHRDIKPSNLLITPHCTLKIVDLGLAYNVQHGQEWNESASILGTPAYMAPEQARDCRKAGPRADVYALGVTLFHMLSGDVPFKRSSGTNLLLAHIHEPVPDICGTIGGLPPPLVALLERMLAKDPSARPADGDELGRELDQIIDTFGRQAAPRRRPAQGPAPRRGRSRRLAGIVGAAGAGALMLVALMAVRPGWPHQLAAGHAQPVPIGSTSAHGESAPAGHEAPPGAPDPAGAAPGQGALPSEAVGAAWQTPQRALVVHCSDVPAEVVVAVHAAMIASGLPVIDRDFLPDPQRERDPARDQRIEPPPALPAGRQVSGHLALDITAVAHRIDVRAVLIGSGELVCDELVEASQAAAAIARAIAASTARLPERGWLLMDALREPSITLGARDGVHVGDRFAVRAGDAVHPGEVVGIAIVSSLERDSASVRFEGMGHPFRPPALVSRMSPHAGDPPGISDR